MIATSLRRGKLLVEYDFDTGESRQSFPMVLDLRAPGPGRWVRLPASGWGGDMFNMASYGAFWVGPDVMWISSDGLNEFPKPGYVRRVTGQAIAAGRARLPDSALVKIRAYPVDILAACNVTSDDRFLYLLVNGDRCTNDGYEDVAEDTLDGHVVVERMPVPAPRR